MSLANLDLTVVLQQASIDASSVLFIFNITFIVLLVLAALIGLIRGVWRAGFRFLFVLTALVALWFLSPGIIESLMDYPVKGLLEPIGWEVETLRELPNYLAQNGDFTDDLKAIFSNQDIQELLLGLLQAILTFVVFFIGGVLIILLSWPLSTLLYAFVRYAIPKKWRKERKLRPVGALIGVIQALVSFSVLLMPFSVVNNALSNIDRKNLEGNKEILTIYDLGRVYGDSFAGQLFSVFALPFSNGAKAQLWASDQLLTMKFKSNSIVLTDEIDVFMNVFDELLKAGAVDIVFEADAGLTVYFNTNIGNLKLPSGAIDVANKGTFDPFTFDGNLGSSYYEYLASHGKFNPYLWDYNAINNQFNLPYFENGYVYQGGEFVLDPTYQMITYLQSLGFEFDPGKLDVPTLTAYIETYLPHVNLGDPTTWGLDREYSVSSRYEVEVLQKIIDVNLPKMSSVPLVLDPNFGTFPYYAFNLNNTFDLGSTGSLAAIIAANLPYININFNDWKINVSTGSFGNIALPNEGNVNLDNSKLEDLLDILSPELVKDILNLISDSDLIVNTLPVALDIALVLPSLEEYFDASKINPSDLELTSEEWAAELQQIGEVASRIIELDVIRDVLNNNKEYFGYDPNKVQELGFEFAKLKLATQILPAALPAVLPNVVDVEYYEGLGLDSVDFSKYNWEQEFQKISIMAANALKLDLEGIVDQDIDYFTQDSEAVSNILNALTESQVIMDIIPNAIDYALTLDVVKEYTKDVEINLPEVDWATEIRDLGRVYTEIAKVGGDPRDVKWGLTDEETEAKVAAIEAAIDILFKSQLINGLLPTLAEIGVNYLEAPYNEAVDPDLIDFEDLNLSEEVKNAFRAYRLIIDEDGELNDKILTYSDDKIRQIADFIGNSDIVVPLLPNAINVLGKHFEVDKYIDLDTELFEDVNWADTIYNLVGVGKYFVDEENNPKVDIVNLTDENILDIATRLDNTELVNRLLPSAVKKILTIYEYDKYYKEDMLDYENLSVGTEISYFLRVLRALNFEFDIETQDFNLNLDFKTYDDDDMISVIESELNASTLLKDLYPVMLEIVQDNLPDDYKDLIDLSNLKIENLGSEIANIIRVLKVVGGNVDIGKGKISLNLDFTTYTDPMIYEITDLLRGSKLLDDLFRLLLDTFENIIYEQTEIEIDLDEYVTDDIIIGEEIGNIIRIAREVELKINEDFTLGTYNIKVATYSDDQINKLAAAVGSSKLVKNILPAAVDIAKDYVPDPYVKLIDKDAYDFDLVDLEIDLSKLLKAARLFLNEDNEIVPRFYDLTDAEIELVADAIASSTLIKMVINPTIDKLVEHSKDILGLDINEYVDLRVIEDYTAIDLQNEFDSLLRIARSLVATNPESLEYPYTVKFNTTEEERIEVANALNKMTLIDELLPSLFEKVSNLDMVKGYIDLTKVNLDNVRIGDEVKGVLELLDLVSEDYFNLTMELEVVNKPGVIDLAVKVINESVLIKEVASVAFDMVFDNQDLIDKGIDLNKYLSRDVLDFETINLGDEIKPFLLVLSSLVEKGNQIDINLDITPEEYAEIELAFANTTILPTIIKDVKNNLPEILDGIKDGLSSTIVDFFDFDAYDLEDLDWGKELTNFVKIGVAVVDMTDKGNYELDLELTDDEIELIAEAINNSEIFIRAVETALTTIINNTDLYEKFLKGVELIDYYDPSKLNLRETGKLGNDIAQLLKVAREFVTDGLKFELKLSEISEETYDVIAQSVNNLEILRHVLETLLTRPYRITYKNIKINSTDYITFDDYFTDYQFGEDFVRLLKVATVFVSDNYKFELKTKFSADEVDLISSNLGNLKLLNMIIDKGVNAVAKYFELDEELVDKADLANLDLESELYQLLRVVNALEVDINDPISMLNLTEDQYEEIGEAIREMKLIKGLVPLAAGIALSYYSDFEFVNEIDINEINFDNIDFGDEVIRIFKIIEQVDFEIINKDGAISFSYNNVINSYTHEQIDIIAEQIGGSNLVKELLPIGARIGVGYIPAEYRDLVNLDDVDFDELDLTVELTNIAKAAILFFNDNNVLTIRIDTLSADEIATIAKVGSSKLISMVINHAVYTFADKSSDILGKFGLKLDINEYVDLKSIDYSAIDLEGELVSILTIARQVVVVKDNKFDYRLDLNTDQIALIEENINKLDLVKQLLESAINVMSTHKFVEPYVDLTELDINSFDLGKELGRFLEIASAISGADGKLVLALELIKDDALVDLVVNVLNDSEILKALAPSAIDKVFDNEMLLNSGIKLSDYLDRNAIDVSEVKWGDELRPALYAFGALIVVDNTVRLTLDFEESDYAKIADAFNKSTLIPQLVTNAQANVQYVINRYSEGDLYQFITNFIDIDGLDLVDGINWGDELVGILKVVKGIVGFVDDGGIKVSIDLQLDVEDVEAIREFINGSELIVRIAENALDTTINNPEILGMFISPLKGTTISEYHDFADLDFRTTHKLGDEIANILYVARHFVNDQNQIVLDLDNIDEVVYEEIETNINKSKLIPYLIDTAARVAVENLGVRIEDVDLMVKHYIDLSDVDFYSIEYGSEIAKLLKSAMVFKVPGEYKIGLKLSFTEDEVLTIADNLGTSELLELALRKGIIGGLKLFGLDKDITIEDIKFDELVIRDELYHLLSVVRILNLDINNILGSVSLDTNDVEEISEHLNNVKILEYVAPVAASYVISESSELFGIDLTKIVDVEAIDLEAINWGDELTAVLSLVASVVETDSDKFLIRFDLTEAEASLIEESFNKSELIPLLAEQALNNIDNLLEESIVNLVRNIVDLDTLDLFDGINLGSEIVGIIRIADKVVAIEIDEELQLTLKLDIDLSEEDLEVVRVNLNDSDLLVKVVENVVERVTTNPYWLEKIIPGATISEYYDFTTIDFKDTYKLGDEIVNLLAIGRHFVTNELKIAFDFGLISEEVFDDISVNINKSKLIPHLVEVAANVAVEHIGIRLEDVDFMVKDYIDLSDVNFDAFSYGDELVKFIKVGQVFYEDQTFKLKFSFTEDEVTTIATNLGSSEIVDIALEKGITAGLKLFGLDDQITLEDLEYATWDLTHELTTVLNIVNSVDVDLEAPLSMLKLSDDSITSIADAVRTSKIVEVALPLGISYFVENSEGFIKYDVAQHFDPSLINYDEIDWGNEIKLALAAARHFINDENVFVITSDFEIKPIVDDIYDELNESRLIPQALNIALDINSEYTFKFNEISITVNELINKDRIDFNDYRLGDEVKLLSDVAQFVITKGFKPAVTLDLSDEEFDLIENNLNTSALFKDLISNVLDTTYRYGVLGFNSYIELPSGYTFEDVENWGSEIVNIARLAAKHIDLAIDNDKFTFTYSLKDITDSDIEQLRDIIKVSELLPVVIPSLIRALDTNPIALDYVTLFTDLHIDDFVDVDGLVLDVDWAEEIYGLAKIAQAYLENGYFTFRIAKFEEDIQTIESNLSKSGLIKELFPLVYEGLVNNLDHLLDKFNINLGVDIDKYIDINRLLNEVNVEDIDLGKEVGIALRLVNPLFNENNEVIFTIESMDEEFIENVRTQVNKSNLIPNVVDLVLEQVIGENSLNLEIDLGQYINLDEFDIYEYNLGDELAHAIRIIKIFDISDGIGFDDIKLGIRFNLTDDEIGIIEEEINNSVLVNDLIPLVAEHVYKYFKEPKLYINLDDFDYSEFNYGSELAVALKVAREMIKVNDKKLSPNSVSLNLFNLEEDAIQRIGDAVSESELIPTLAPRFFDRLGNFSIKGYKFDFFVNIDTLKDGITDIDLGEEVKLGLRLAKVYGNSVEGNELVRLTDDSIESIRVNLNESALLRLVVNAAVYQLETWNAFEINKWITLSELDLEALKLGDEIAEFAYIAREFYDFDAQAFDTGLIAYLSDEQVDKIATHLNNSDLVAQALPIAIRLLDSNDIIDKYVKFDFRSYIDVTTLDLDNVKFGDEFKHIYHVASLFTDDFETFTFDIKALTDDDLAVIERELNDSVLISKVVTNAVAQEAVKTYKGIDKYVDLELVDLDRLAWGSEIAGALTIAKLIVNDNNEFELRVRFDNEEINTIKVQVGKSVLVPRVIKAAIETIKSTNVHSINRWVNLDDIEVDLVNWADEVEHALKLVRYFNEEGTNDININKLTLEALDEIRTRLNASTLVKQVAAGVIENVYYNDVYNISRYVDLTAVSYDDIDSWGDEAYYALRVLNNYILGFGEYDFNLAYIDDEIIDSVRLLGNNSRLVEKLAPVAIETSRENNVHNVNDWVDLTDIDTTVISWGEEAAEALRVAQIFSDGYSFYLRYNFLEEEIETVREVLNGSTLVKQLAPGAINRLGEVNRFDVLTYADGLADIDFTSISAWGDEVARAMRISNIVMYDDGVAKIFYPFTEEEITTIKDLVNESEIVPLVAPNVIETFDRNDLYGINTYVDLAGLDYSDIAWGDEAELALQVISYFSPYEGTFELLFNDLTDEQVDRLSYLAGQSKLVPLVAPRVVSTAFAYGHYDIDLWLYEEAFDYDALDYAVEAKAALLLLRDLTNEYGEFITSIDFTDEQIATVKEAVAMSNLVDMLAPSFIENASTNYLTIASDLLDYTVFDYSTINYADEFERVMLVVREFAHEDTIYHSNIQLLDEEAVETVATSLGSSEFVRQAAESTIERAIDVFEIPYIEYADLDFTDLDYVSEIRTLIKLFKLISDENGEVTEEELEFDVLETKADELGVLVAQSQLLTSALPNAIPRALPYDEETFPYDLSEVNYDDVVWSTEVASLIKLLALVGADMEGGFEFDFETAERDDVVTLGNYLSETLIGQFIFGELVKDAIVGFEFAGLTEEDLDYENITNWGEEVIRLYDIIQIVVDEDGNARDFATLTKEESDELATNLGNSELFVPILEDVVVNTIEDGGFDDIVPVEHLYFGSEVDPLDWVNELTIFLDVYRTIDEIDFDNFSIDHLDNAESLLISMLDSKIIYTNAYPYIFSNVAVKMGLDDIEGANFEVDYLIDEIHSLGKDAWINEIETLIDLYEEVDALGGIDAIDTLTLKTIKDSGKDVSEVFKTIAHLVLDSKILGIPTLEPIIIDTIDLGEDSKGNDIPLADTTGWSIEDWRAEIDHLGLIIDTLGVISEDYNFEDVTLDTNEDEHNRALGTLLNQAYDSALIGEGINTKISDIITTYEEIVEYVDVNVVSEVRELKPGTDKEGWIGEIEILQALRRYAETYDLGDPDAVSSLTKEDLGTILHYLKDSHITNSGLPKVVKNALIGVGIDDMLDYELGEEPSRFENLPFDIVKDHANSEIDKLVELYASVKELGDLKDINWRDEGTTPKLAAVIIDLVKTDLFNGVVAIPNSDNPATEDDADVLLLSGIFRNANLADTLDAVRIITIAGDDITNENDPEYVSKLVYELDLIIDIRNELFVDNDGNPVDTMNHNNINAELLKKLNASSILKDDALPNILKEGLITVGFDDYINSDENPNAFDSMNFVAIKDDAEIDRLMAIYDFAKDAGEITTIDWDSLDKEDIVDKLNLVTTSNVIKPVRGIMVDNVFANMGFDKFYAKDDITSVDTNDSWEKEILSIETSLDLVKLLNDSTSKGLTGGETNSNLIRAMMLRADDTIVMNRIIRGVLDEQMTALGVDEFRWSKANRAEELDLGDTAHALAALIDLTKLMRDVNTDTVITKLANNMSTLEYPFDLTKPNYEDTSITGNRANRIFNDLQSEGNVDGRTLVDSLMEIFIKEAVPSALDKFANIDWTAVNYSDEVQALQFAAMVDGNYSTYYNRHSFLLVGLMDQIYTVEGETIDDVTLNSPFAVAFLAATDAHIVLTEAETITLRTDYVKGSIVKEGLIRTVYKLVE